MKQQIIFDALRHLTLTHSSGPKQSTIVVLKDQTCYGFFPDREIIKENGMEVNKWKFVLFPGGKEIVINGDDIVSISLEENGRRLYCRTDSVEENLMHLSRHAL